MTNRPFKALFITHDTSNYGASRSLQLLLKNYQNVKADLIVQRYFFKKHKHDDLRTRFGGQVSRIWETFLPFATCYQYGRKGALFSLLIKFYNRTLARIGSRQVEHIAAVGTYDFIHLNSLVLHSLISDRYPFVLHMRDVYDGTDSIAVRNVQKARGVIFIDESTRLPFRNIPLRNSLVLNNPFDMSSVAEYADYRPDYPRLDTARNTIFSTIGVANDKKGTGFIIGVFMKMKHPDARLLVVGGREPAALAAYRRIARADRRIIFWGEEPNIMKIYAISDYVLRAEEFPCVGRTVYEGLYSGCRVLLPGDRNAPPPMFEYETYRDAIFFYHPRNEHELLDLFQRLVGNKVRKRSLRSNVDAYVRNFHDFISSLGQAKATVVRQEN